MARSFNVSFNITGALDGSLMSALKNAQNALRGLGNSARAASVSAKASQAGLQGLANSLNAIQNAGVKFKTLQDALKQTTAEFGKSGAALEAAKAKMQADAQAAEQLRQKLSQLKTEMGKARTTKANEQAGLKTLRQQMQELKRAFDLAKSLGNTAQMNQLASQMAILGTTIQAQQAKVKTAVQAYKELSDKAKQLKTELKAAEQAASQSGKGYSEARNNAERLKASYQQQLAALSRLKASLSQAGFNVSNFASSESRLQSEINRVNAALERQAALANAQRASSQASQEMFNAYNNFQGALQTAEQIAAPFKSATENAMDFEYAMSKVKSLTQMRNIRAGNLAAVREEMEALTAQAEELGATTEFTSREVAEAMGFYGMAGWDTSRIQNAMQHTIDLATIAGDHNIQRMADVLSDDMTAMGLKAGEMITLQNGKTVESSKYFADAFAYALTNANVNRESLHEALKYNAPIAKQWGLTMGEEFAINMMSANAGIKGSMAGTGLRAGLLRISAPPKKAAKAFEEMGLSMSDAQKELAEGQAAMKAYGVTIGDFATTLRSLGQVYNSLSRGERLGFVDAVFGKNASSFWANILDKGNIEGVLKAAQEIDTGWVEDYAKDTASVMRDNTKISLELLKSSLDALERSIGQALLPTIRAAAESFAPLVTAIGEWVAANPAVVQGAAAIAAALAGIIVSAAAVKLAFAGWSFVTAQIALVRAALASLGSGALLGGLVGRLAALRAALFGLGGAATLSGWGAMFGAIAARAAAARVAVMGFFASLSLSGALAGAKAAITGVGTAIMGAVRAAFAFAFSPVGVALMALALAGMYCYQNWDRVGPVLSNIAGIIGGALSSAISTVSAALTALSSSGAFDALIATAGTLASVVGGTLVKAFTVLLTVAASTIAVILQLLGDAIKTVIDFGSGMADAIGKLTQGDFSGAVESLGNTASKTLDNIRTAGEHIFDGVVQGAQNVQQVLDALNMPKLPTQDVTTRHRVEFDSSGAAHSAAPAPAPEAPALDTSATQASLDAVGQSAQNAATNIDGVNQATQNISQAGDALANIPAAVQPTANAFANLPASVQPTADAFAQLPAAVQPAADGLNQMSTTLPAVTTEAQNLSTAMQADSTSIQSHTAAVDANSAALNANIGALQAFGAACEGAIGGVTALGSAASSAAGSVSGLGAAAQSACAQLAAAGANAAAQVNTAVASINAQAAPTQHNAEGGIYRKGAFLTTFAERSPEAAIPIESTKRAKDLWTTVGQMLGLLPSKNPYSMLEGYEPRMIMHDTLAAEIMRKQAPNPDKGYSGSKTMENARRPSAIGDWLRSRLGQQQIFRREYGGAMPKVRRLPRGLNMPTLGRNFPSLTTPPTFPQVDSQGDGGGLIGRLAESLFGSNQKNDSDLPPINITLNLTINGQADAGEVQRGVESAIQPLPRSIAAELRDYKREQLRRSYA